MGFLVNGNEKFSVALKVLDGPQRLTAKKDERVYRYAQKITSTARLSGEIGNEEY